MSYINVYEYSRAYSGPEEGGTWHDEWTVISTHRARGPVDSDRARFDLNRVRRMYGFTPSTAKAYQRATNTYPFGSIARTREQTNLHESRMGQVDKLVVRIESVRGTDGNNWQPYC